MEEDPSQRIPIPRVGKRLPQALTIPQVQALFTAMNDETPAGHRDQVFFKLLYTCGLRMGEAIQVRVTDINWEEGWLRVIGKGNIERRVYLKPCLVQVLREYIEESEVEAYLFPSRDGYGHLRGWHMGRRLKGDRGVGGDTERGDGGTRSGGETARVDRWSQDSQVKPNFLENCSREMMRMP